MSCVLRYVAMQQAGAQDPFHGIFVHSTESGLERHPQHPTTLPDPQTGRALKIATVELSGAICPACDNRGEGDSFRSSPTSGWCSRARTAGA